MAEQDTVEAQATWIDGLQFVGHGGASNVAIVMDGAPEHGGTGTSVRPVELLLVSLAGCTAMDVISIMKKKRQHVTGFSVRVKGLRAEEFPKRYVRIELEYVARGWDLSPEALARSIELSQTKYCPVTASLNAEIVYTYRIEAEQGPDEG